jgi:hypothetical protein
MAHVLAMATFKFRDPIAILVLMEADNFAKQSPAPRKPIEASP